MSRAVRAGQTVFSAMQVIGDDFQPPVSQEFAHCYEQQNLGVSVESSLRDLARRTGIMELQMFVVGILVQSRSGGDLNELLDTLAHTIRNRLKLAAKLRAMTGEGRMQAIVLGILPLAAFVMLYFMAPEYIASLLNRPWLLAGTFAAQALGALWVRSIVRLDV
jgi:tight adherence protein B